MKDHTKGIKVGDIITAYHAGYHKVTKVVDRLADQTYSNFTCVKVGDPISSLVYYIKVANKNGKLLKGKKENRCDVSYCKKLTLKNINLEYNNTLKEASSKCDNLSKLLEVL